MESELAYYKFTITFMDYEDLDDPLSLKEVTEAGLVVADSYSNATYKVCDYYGDQNIVSITISGEIDCDVATNDEILAVINGKKE